MPIKSKYIAIRIGKGLKYALFASNIVAIILLLLSTQAHNIPPSQAILIAYLGLGFPILLILNLLFLILWIVFLQWKYILVSVIALACCWNSISTYFSFNTSAIKEIPEESIKFMSYNVRGFNWLTGSEARSNPILEYISTSGADIICMQEFAVEEKKRENNIISLEEFDDVMQEYPYRTIIRLGDTGSSTIYGLACYSKYPIMKVARIPIESEFNGSAMYEIRIKRKSILIVNNHLESNHLTTEDKELYKELVKTRNRDMIDEVADNIHNRLGSAFRYREIQANSIANAIQHQKENADAMIVCGDFNDPPISYAYNTIKGDEMLDAFKISGKGLGITYHQDGFWFRIDYILYTRNIRSSGFTVDKVNYSDHYPIWSYLSIRYI